MKKHEKVMAVLAYLCLLMCISFTFVDKQYLIVFGQMTFAPLNVSLSLIFLDMILVVLCLCVVINQKKKAPYLFASISWLLVGFYGFVILNGIDRFGEMFACFKDLSRFLESFCLTTYALGFLTSFVFSLTATVSLIRYQKIEVTGSKEEKPEEFAFLKDIDEKYAAQPFSLEMREEDKISLAELTEKFINYAASNLKLYYSKKTISSFIAGLSSSRIIILEGISGTGKTSLPYAFSRFLMNPATIVSVQPFWKDKFEILGYFNEFTKTFNETDFLKCIYEAGYRNDISLCILDEFNIARIEYYFAEFLSVMELPDKKEWNISVLSRSSLSDPKNIVSGKIHVPQNLWYIGTANRDDSTYTITDKVYDRSCTIYLNERAKPFEAPETSAITMTCDYLEGLFEKARKEHPISESSRQLISQIDEYLFVNFKVMIGNRIFKQMESFIPTFVACGNEELDAIDQILCTKVFRKLESLNLSFMKKNLEKFVLYLQKLGGKDAFPVSIDYIRDLIRIAG